MTKRKVSLTLDCEVVAEVDKIVMKKREQQKDDRVLKVVSRSEVIEDLMRIGLKVFKEGKR